MAERLVTDRLVLRSWEIDDAPAALEIYGDADVARWLSPIMDQVPNLAAMRVLVRQWIVEDLRAPPPTGRWCIQRREDAAMLGGATLLYLPPGGEDLELGWHLDPSVWGQGYASESTYALAQWAFRHDVDEVFAVVRPENTRATSLVRRNGMEWVGETSKYFGLTMELYRLRPADLDQARQSALPTGFETE
ncbi:GNAT family N-acetyltransferase [Saccharopolyspora sp. SCSIO 74807]|uniref:GNAT family N-acetyltransferase n=1 Tax=Saccharopolyspora sp. SCSIO 74807 TaxID=3118084 RepID=UPI0030D204B8